MNDLNRLEFDVLSAVLKATDCYEAKNSTSFDVEKGWLSATQIAELSGYEGPNIRVPLQNLTSDGFLNRRSHQSVHIFRIARKGRDRVNLAPPDESQEFASMSSSWTGIIQPIQVHQVMVILSDMEDVCERISNNHDRAQIFGLIRALEALVNLPDPPRQGVVSLVRDPAFANVVQVGTFLAALIAAVKP
ncbi:hypothetical protein EKN06_03155 [Croceicoccus ponticola]|uniref:Uncharacterized protein n=1 Tax=Croceicoccus ponticola TaxID=2217664 RepID=A0A437H127_9SPHN|nr:hypothetical protein [Croceicoccus ponticola]RVQ69212.1 hypothetical protein EKN06_03155 [Croceicoccus ponticola]